MATVWAKQTGNWTDSNIWAFWNETAQQIENYGQIPQADDVVYLNGFAVTLGYTSVTRRAKEIHNGTNPYTGIAGGYLIGYNFTLVSDLYCEDSSYLFNSNFGGSSKGFNINGNIYIVGSSPAFNAAQGGFSTLIINGNIYADSYNGTIFQQPTNYPHIIIVNGNIVAPMAILATAYTTVSPTSYITVNGNCEVGNLQSNGSVSKGTVTGILIINTTFSYNYFTTNRIHYRTSFNVFLGRVTPIDPATFECRYIGSEPNPNPYIIINPNTIIQTYPPENKVLDGTIYGSQNEFVGIYTTDYPPESVVLNGYIYDRGNKTGNMSAAAQVGCVTKEDVREGVALLGMGEVGTLVVPSADDVREGVVFDNGTIGTLIVQGGGDRLRIADFGYYTNSQSDTYIVDITEADKPKFASAEERILIEMFPDLDLDNIPEMYFDDLFVKYLKYRLIVEYYRTAGVNSTFTPSEPTTEIVNYRNVTCEVWLNSANIYLNAWNKKYGLNKPPQKIRL